MAHEDLWERLVAIAREAEAAGGSSSGGCALVAAALSALMQARVL
jgi:Asp-tRNA(Asn)/Glu-tRNA(Gln) amidotransferase A subunit family amidase